MDLIGQYQKLVEYFIVFMHTNALFSEQIEQIKGGFLYYHLIFMLGYFLSISSRLYSSFDPINVTFI